jgi:hypothetical protein
VNRKTAIRRLAQGKRPWLAAGCLLAVLAGCLVWTQGRLARADDAPTQNENPPAEADKPPQVGDNGVLTFPGLKIDPASRKIEVEAWFVIVQSEKPLEYFAVHSKGKMHETLLALECSLEKLNLGLLLCGLEPLADIQYQGEPRAPKGPRVALTVRYELEGKVVERRAEELIYDMYTGRDLRQTGFAFAGSRFTEQKGAEGEVVAKRFAAEATGNAIALYHDPDALLDLPLLLGGDIPLLAPTFQQPELVDWLSADDRFFAYPGRVPERGTGCTLILRPLGHAAKHPGAPGKVPPAPRDPPGPK